MAVQAGTSPRRRRDDVVALVNAGSPLIGRDAELDRVDDLLAEPSPALVLVVGDPGRGKSAFMREAAARAAKRGWNVARSDDRGDFSITPSTSTIDVGRRLRRMLNLPARAAVRAAHLARAKAAPSELTGSEAFADSIRQSEEAPWPGLDELLRDLGKRSPVLVLIDGYRPSEGFERSFTGAFLPALMEGRHPVAVVIAERDAPLDNLKPLATEEMPFDPVTPGPVRVYLDEVTRGGACPLSPEELDAYAAACARDPDLIGSFARLLTLQGTVAP